MRATSLLAESEASGDLLNVARSRAHAATSEAWSAFIAAAHLIEDTHGCACGDVDGNAYAPSTLLRHVRARERDVEDAT